MSVAPTDISQFVRLGQCQRHLRLRLHEKNGGTKFFNAIGAAPVEIPAVLTKSGLEFEARVEAAIQAAMPSVHFPGGRRPANEPQEDNEAVVNAARALEAGGRIALLQSRLSVELDGWHLTGIADLIRLSRTNDGDLEVLVVDFKSSKVARLEHRLQAAIYRMMLGRLFEDAGIAAAPCPIAILYRGGSEAAEGDEQRRQDAFETLGVADALLDLVKKPEELDAAARDLLLSPESLARRASQAQFDDLPFHLDQKCDGCLYNEVCLKWCAQHDDLSLIPHLSEQEKSALRRRGIRTARELAVVREREPQTADLLSTTWPVGPRLDELIARAQQYRRSKGDAFDVGLGIAGGGDGSLPFSAPDQNPNLVRVYLNAEHDYLNDRVYLLGALIVGAENGAPSPRRRRSVIKLADDPPANDEIERKLLRSWIDATIGAIVELAAPDEKSEKKAPIHLIFFERSDQRVLLEALGRHAQSLLSATPLFDFVTQLAAFDSPVATFLDEEIRRHRNYPMVCHSLQSLAIYRKFDWDAPRPFRKLFRKRMFDYVGRFDDAERPDGDSNPWFTRQARFSSGIPLEYAYAAWGALDSPDPDYAAITPELIVEFETRRLEAIEKLSGDLPENKKTQQRAFDLPDLSSFREKADTLAEALREFVMIERHAELGAWKSARQVSPERRVLAGDSLIVRYLEEDQGPGVAAKNRQNLERWLAREMIEPGPDGKRLYPKELNWNQDNLKVRLRVESIGGASPENLVANSTLHDESHVVVMPRWTFDSRKPAAEREPFAPTIKQLLRGSPAMIERIGRGAPNQPETWFVDLVMRHGAFHEGDVFSFAQHQRPFEPGEAYTIDVSPNDVTGGWSKSMIDGLCDGGGNALYDRLSGAATERLPQSEAARTAQVRFLNGLLRLAEQGDFHNLEFSKQRYIGELGDAPVVLVQGPPGTGKSFTSGFAILSRIQAAMADERACRVVIACKTHAAIEVLLEQVFQAILNLKTVRRRLPALFAAYFDPRLLDVTLFRVKPSKPPASGIIELDGDAAAARTIEATEWCVVASTPGQIRKMLHKSGTPRSLFNRRFADVAVLDEASQMSLPEAIMATLPLKDEGQAIIVGDHRQMPPIIKHNWLQENRRTFQEFRAYESVFVALREATPRQDWIQFHESFRLHEAIAEFLRREIYQHDGIPYFSRRTDLLPRLACEDPFVEAALSPNHPLVVVVHDEESSQVRNEFEQRLISPILRALADRDDGLGLDVRAGLGVVVPHRAQRAALRDGEPCLSERSPITGEATACAVDTVERFQGGEREAILICATESDRQYLLLNGEFLLDPRRLNVALSRAKKKLILVASSSVFELFSTDEDAFANAQIWKNLLRLTCTARLWEGTRDDRHVVVYGNVNPRAIAN